MAATPIRIYHYLTGFTGLKVVLYPLAGGAAVNPSGAELTQSADGEFGWQATITEDASGPHRYEVMSGDDPVAWGFITLQDDTHTYHGEPSPGISQIATTDTAALIEALPVAVRNELLNRVLQGNHNVSGSMGAVLQAIVGKTNTIPANPAAVGSQMGLTTGAINGLISGIESYLAGDGDKSLVAGELIVPDSAAVSAMSGKALTIAVETEDEGRRYTARLIVAEVNRQ